MRTLVVLRFGPAAARENPPLSAVTSRGAVGDRSPSTRAFGPAAISVTAGSPRATQLFQAREKSFALFYFNRSIPKLNLLLNALGGCGDKRFHQSRDG